MKYTRISEKDVQWLKNAVRNALCVYRDVIAKYTEQEDFNTLAYEMQSELHAGICMTIMQNSITKKKSGKGFEVLSTDRMIPDWRDKHPYSRNRGVYGKTVDICEDHRYAVVNPDGTVFTCAEEPFAGAKGWYFPVVTHACRAQWVGSVAFTGDWRESLVKIEWEKENV